MKLNPLPLLLLSATVVAFDVSASKGEQTEQHAGGVRADHASEQGLEKGKAWAGSKTKKEKKEKSEKTREREKKHKKEKKPKG